MIAEELEDRRLRWLARRIVFAERPELLAADHRQEMAREKAARMISDAPEGWLTIGRAVEMASLTEGHTDTARLVEHLLEKEERARELVS